MMKRYSFLLAVGMAGILGLAAAADAAVLRIRCERRGSRSKISVDARGLAAGAYRAGVSSGSNEATSAPQAAVGGEAEFDFDSNRADIRAGATAISATFIQGGRVQARVLDAAGTVVAQGAAACQVR